MLSGKYLKLGLTLYNRGDMTQALEYFNKALDLEKSARKKNRAILAAAYNNIASVHERQGKHNVAIGQYSKALELFREELGDDNPNTLSVMNNMAFLLLRCKKFAKALEMCHETLTISEKKLGKEHEITKFASSMLSLVHRKQENEKIIVK